MTEIEGDERSDADRAMDTGRVLALSDGVFAIAATLLVLDLRLPDDVTLEEVPGRLHELVPSFGSYVVSYVLIGLLWIGHHRQFRNFRLVSLQLARLNLLFLGSVSVLSFVTAVLRYDVAIAVQLYAFTIGVIFVLAALMDRVAGRRGYHADPAEGRRQAAQALLTATVFLLSIPIASMGEHGPSLAKYFWLLLFPASWVLHLVTSRRSAVRQRESEQSG